MEKREEQTEDNGRAKRVPHCTASSYEMVLSEDLEVTEVASLDCSG